jgi:hypothetical protein
MHGDSVVLCMVTAVCCAWLQWCVMILTVMPVESVVCFVMGHCMCGVLGEGFGIAVVLCESCGECGAL